MKYKNLEKINKKIISAIDEMGFVDLTPIQEATITTYLEESSKDIIAQAQTGTGKTASFALPILNELDFSNKNPEALIIAPTRELATQIYKEIKKMSKYLDLNMALILGGISYEKQFKELFENPKIIIATPGRMIDLLNNERVSKKFDVSKIKFFVLDEADELLKIGFQKEIEAIIEKLPKKRTNYFFTATFDKKTKNLADIMTHDAKSIMISAGLTTSKTITQHYLITNEKYKLNDLIKFLICYDVKNAIIFGRTKRRVDQLNDALNNIGFKAYAIQGNMQQSDRNFVMNRFRNNGGGILIATDVVSRGIDIDHVDWVINFDLPQEIEYYTHRIGRVGRAGREGHSISFTKIDEIEHLNEIKEKTKSNIIKIDLPNENEYRDLWLNKVFDFHKEILNNEEDSPKHIEKELIEKFSKDELASILTHYILNSKKLKSNIKLSPEPSIVLKGNAKVRHLKSKINGRNFSNSRNRDGDKSRRKNNNFSNSSRKTSSKNNWEKRETKKTNR